MFFFVSPGSRYAMLLDSDSTYALVRIKDGKVVRSGEIPGGQVQDGSIDDSGRYLALYRNNDTSAVFAGDSGEKLTDLQNDEGRKLQHPLLAPDGSWGIATNEGRPSLYQFDPKTGKTKSLMDMFGCPTNYALASSGKFMLAMFANDPARGVVVAMPSGREIRSIEGLRTDRQGRFSISPDGKHVATYTPDRTVEIWNLETGKRTADLGQPGYVVTPSWVGPYVALINGRGILALHDARSGALVQSYDTGLGVQGHVVVRWLPRTRKVLLMPFGGETIRVVELPGLGG